MKLMPILLVSTLLSCVGCLSFFKDAHVVLRYENTLDNYCQAIGPAVTADMLSTNSVSARFIGVEERGCPGYRTTLCPEKCKHGGKMAIFKILKYKHYEKLSQYGDEQQDELIVKISELNDKPTIAKGLYSTITSLRPGCMVDLDWNHIYVKTQQAHYPVRFISFLALSTKQ